MIVSGKDFSYAFDKSTNSLVSIMVNGKEMIKKGAELNVWRAPLANETDEWGFWQSNNKHRTDGYGRMAATEWYSAGLDSLHVIKDLFNVKIVDNENVIIEIKNVELLATRQGSIYKSLYIIILMAAVRCR